MFFSYFRMSDLLLEIYSFEDKFDMDRMHTLSERD